MSLPVFPLGALGVNMDFETGITLAGATTTEIKAQHRQTGLTATLAGTITGTTKIRHVSGAGTLPKIGRWRTWSHVVFSSPAQDLLGDVQEIDVRAPSEPTAPLEF